MMDDKIREKLKTLEEIETAIEERCANLDYTAQKRLAEFVRSEINALCATAEGQKSAPSRENSPL
jgi:hypothetical protein